MSEDWRIEETAEDFFGQQRRRQNIEKRRPQKSRSDLVGPGIRPNAVRVDDWNDLLAFYNGYFSSQPGAFNAPVPLDANGEPAPAQGYVGVVVSDGELGGIQRLTGLVDKRDYVRVFSRADVDAGTVDYGEWVEGTDSTTVPEEPEEPEEPPLVAPGSSPRPSVEAGAGMLFVNWNHVNQSDVGVVTYDVHVSPFNNFTPVSGNRAATTTGTVAVIDQPPGTDPFYDGTTYYVKIVARNAEGAAPPSVQVSAVMELITGTKIGPDSISSPMMRANSVLAGAIKSGAVTAEKLEGTLALVSRLVAGNPNFQRVELAQTGFYAYNASGQKTIDIQASTGRFRGYNPSTGAVTFEISTSDGSVTAVGSFKTGFSGQRVEVSNDTVTFRSGSLPPSRIMGINSLNNGYLFIEGPSISGGGAIPSISLVNSSFGSVGYKSILDMVAEAIDLRAANLSLTGDIRLGGVGATPFNILNWGVASLSTNSSGLATLSHYADASPGEYIILITTWGNFNSRFFTVVGSPARDSVTVRVDNAAGETVKNASGQNCVYIVIGLK